MKIKIILFRSAFVLSVMSVCQMARAEEVWRYRGTEVVDSPTAEVVDHYGWLVSFRFGRDGNLQSKTMFGVFPRLNIGFGLDGEGIIGTGTTRLNKPSINARFRIFDGKGVLPALALGYDGQGYVYNRDLGQYEQRELGFFLAATSEILVSNMFLSYGVNRYDFGKDNATRGFVGWSYVYQQLVGLLAEWDQLGRYNERRINYGLKYFISPVFTVDLVGRNIPDGVDTPKRITERIVRLSYTGSF